MQAIRMALIGAGNRGRGVFGQYALDMPHRAKFVAVVEPDEKRRDAFAAEHSIFPDKCFDNYDDFFANRDESIDAVVIATVEDNRKAPIFKAMKQGYHLLVEKPLGTNQEEVIEICRSASDYDKVFMVCHQMRYTPLYNTLKSLIDSGHYGSVISIQHSENLSYHHMAHSFVRGLFNSSKLTPMILAKSCHDMDLIKWLAYGRRASVSSFGSLMHFKPENAPAGSAKMCLDGCSVERNCPYSALKIYFNDKTDPAYLRQMGSPQTKEELRNLLAKNQYGRCVYHCDNDVVDNQVAIINFDNGVSASFAMVGHNAIERRITKVSLTNGELELDVTSGHVKTWTFEPLAENVITPAGTNNSHLGGDAAIMDGFTDAISSGEFKNVLTPVDMSLDSHLMAFAAEEARITGKVVDIA